MEWVKTGCSCTLKGKKKYIKLKIPLGVNKTVIYIEGKENTFLGVYCLSLIKKMKSKLRWSSFKHFFKTCVSFFKNL